MKFRASVSGFITGIRFYKGSTNTGTHVGHLWTATGTLLATATFTGETASGWQSVTLPAPVAVTANTTYVASYFAPVGRYAVNNNGFVTAVTRGPLTALANGTSPNGVYRYGGGGVFPTNTFQASNYWVDVVFDTTASDTTPPTLTERSRPRGQRRRPRPRSPQPSRAGHAGEHRLHPHRSVRCRCRQRRVRRRVGDREP